MWTIEKQRETIRNHYKDNKQYYKDKAKKWKEEIIKWYIELKKTKKCIRCGNNDYRCIDFHHRDPKDKIMEVSKMASHGYSKKKIIKEIEKCDTLCANCHRIEHYGCMV